MPYYRNPRMLVRHLHVWAIEWPAKLKDRLEVVLVDDGSPELDSAAQFVSTFVSHPDNALPRISVYRVLEDRPWHQHGARNLGAHVARAQWLLLTDMDHVCSAELVASCLDLMQVARADDFYTFERRDAPTRGPWKASHWPTMKPTINGDGELKPHVNSFMVGRELYWRVGGYDEDYCGIYGTDQHFRTRLHATGRHMLNPLPLIRVSRDVIPDASTRDVERKTEGRSAAKKAVARAKMAEGRANVISVLNFPWKQEL
jgi:hypothetical protein